MAKEVGAALAAIHDLPLTLVTNADLPSYSANEFRQRKLNELDQAATTGKIPATLLRRWEHALEDVALWRFNPSVVHGDLHEDNLMVQDDAVTALTGWTDLRIGDPADDFAWLVASNEASFVESVLSHYTQARREIPDAHLLRRSALLAEFALAQYLVKAMAAGHQSMTAEAESMLQALADDIDEQARRDEEAAQAAEDEAAENEAAQHEANHLGAADSRADKPAVSVAAIPDAEESGGLRRKRPPRHDITRRHVHCRYQCCQRNAASRGRTFLVGRTLESQCLPGFQGVPTHQRWSSVPSPRSAPVPRRCQDRADAQRVVSHIVERGTHVLEGTSLSRAQASL